MNDMNAPAAAAENQTNIAAAVTAYIETAKSVASDGLTWSEFGHLLTGLLRLAVRLADSLQASGPERKAIVLTAAAALFDAVAASCVPLVATPVWIFARASVRALVLALASGAVEVLLPLVRNADA